MVPPDRAAGHYAWRVFCAIDLCLPVELRAAVADTGDQTPRLTADGRILMGYPGPDGLALIKGMPGARWNRDARHWSVSVEPRDRRRVLEVASKLVREDLTTEKHRKLVDAFLAEAEQAR